MQQTYIIGHKSPDLDSVAAAIAYAVFKNKEENDNRYVSAIAGEVNKETKYILEKYGFSMPEIISNAAGKECILVDHNEFIQSADGMSEAKIIEVLDHHKFDFKYSEPICITNRPVGSSCSLVANLFFKKGIELDSNLASLILAAVLVDTVITKSPTSTEFDKNIITKLSETSGITDWKAFGMEVFKVRASVNELSAQEIIKSDFKDFQFKQGKFGIGQVETVDLKDFLSKEDEILNELNKIKDEGGYNSTILFITDIINEGSKFLIATNNQDKLEEALGAKFEDSRTYIPGVLSRKKQVTPKLTEIFDK